MDQCRRENLSEVQTRFALELAQEKQREERKAKAESVDLTFLLQYGIDSNDLSSIAKAGRDEETSQGNINIGGNHNSRSGSINIGVVNQHIGPKLNLNEASATKEASPTVTSDRPLTHKEMKEIVKATSDYEKKVKDKAKQFFEGFRSENNQYPDERQKLKHCSNQETPASCSQAVSQAFSRQQNRRFELDSEGTQPDAMATDSEPPPYDHDSPTAKFWNFMVAPTHSTNQVSPPHTMSHVHMSFSHPHPIYVCVTIYFSLRARN